ncbi:hypothetical protein [Vibrio harveyi]|uniref:hypothetical protein n=1 Tax=Vibrio harveyi TaxID=669 RepID=UPI0025B0FB27|nr:hypothetical protein [Vibrio harveyi]WJT09281.1 hypothetical protein PH545_24965 [Vibrio harveyi]
MFEQHKEIVYIGSREIKQTEVFGIKYHFPHGEKVAVPTNVAYELLQYPTIYVLPDNVEKVKEERKAEELKRENLAKEAAELKRQEDAKKSWIVYVGGEAVNIGKFPKARLETLIVSEELPLDATNIPKVDDLPPAECLRIAVRDALHTKSGNPELEENDEDGEE